MMMCLRVGTPTTLVVESDFLDSGLHGPEEDFSEVLHHGGKFELLLELESLITIEGEKGEKMYGEEAVELVVDRDP
jgi:hypothetical protein